MTDRVAVSFAIYSDQTGGAPLWQETQNVQFSQGHYSVFLGDGTPGGIPAELFASGQSRWLGVKAVLPGEQEQPRILLASVPYALKAGDADTLGGLPMSAFLRAEEPTSSNIGASTTFPKSQSIMTPSSSTVTTSGGTAGTIPEFQTGTDIENSPITDSGGNISIANQLTVVGASNLNGVLNAASCKPTVRPSWCSGSDIGAWVNAAVSKLASCGEIYIPAGTYNQSVTMSIPRCVKLHGASAMSTRITWTNSSGWAIVVADNNASLDNNFSYEGAVEDLTLYGPGVANTAGAIYLGGSDGAAGSPSTTANPPIQPIADPATNLGDHFNINRVRIMRNPNVTGFNVGVKWGANAWSTTIFQSVVSFCVQAGLFFPPNIGSLNSGEDVSILNSSIQNNVGIGLSLGNGNFVNITAMNTSFDFNGPTASCPGGGACTWQIQNGTSGLSQNAVSLVNSYVTAGDHWLQNFGRAYISGSYFTGGKNSATLGYLIDNENADNFTVSGGQFFNGGTGCITNSAGQLSSWYGVLTTSPNCPNSSGGIIAPAAVIDRFGNGSFTAVYAGGSNVVYRCTSTGVTLPIGTLTTSPSLCGSSTDTGLRVK